MHQGDLYSRLLHHQLTKNHHRIAIAGVWTLFAAIAFSVVSIVAVCETIPQRSVAALHNVGIEGFEYTSVTNSVFLGLISLCCGVFILGIAICNALRKRPLSRRYSTFTAFVLTSLLVTSAMGYFYGSRGIARPYYPRFWDLFHSFLGAKYHDQAGYFGLYECVVEADQGRLVKGTDRIRDLRNYQRVSAATVRAKGQCRNRFTTERWAQFKNDLKSFQFYAMGLFPQILDDLGYNGTPLQTLIAGKTAAFFKSDFRTLTLLSLVDVVSLCCLMPVVCWAFGWQLGFLFSIFFFVNFSDRFAYVGGSYLRYLWMVALGVALSMLKRKHYAKAAIALSTSTMLNVFPALFAVGIAAKMVIAKLRKRPVAPEHVRFLNVFVGTLLFLGILGACHGRGPFNYTDFLSKMATHVKVINQSRVGFEYLFPSRDIGPYNFYDTQSNRDAISSEPMEPLFYLFGFVAIGLGFLLLPKLDDLEASVLLAMLLLFFLFGTVHYYYAVAATMVLLWHRRCDAFYGKAMLGLLFILMGGVYLVWLDTYDRELFDNRTMSAFLGIYLLITLGTLAFNHRRNKNKFRAGIKAASEHTLRS